MLEFVSEADEKIVYVTVEELLTEGIVDALRTAAERGVTISLGGVSPAVQKQIRKEIPEVDPFESV